MDNNSYTIACFYTWCIQNGQSQRYCMNFHGRTFDGDMILQDSGILRDG